VLMRAFFRFMAKGMRIELRGREEFLKELLGTTAQKFLEGCLMSGIGEWKPVEEHVPASVPAPVPAVVPTEQPESPLTLAELRAKANVNNNKELVTLVVYYSDQCKKSLPSNEEIRQLLREELREKDEVLRSMTTYLQRAKKQGWIAQEGKKWRVTSAGIQAVQRMLQSSHIKQGG